MILAIDQGTTNTKALLVDREGQPQARASVRMTISTPRSNWVEQDAEAIWQSVLEAVAACLQLAPGVAVAGVAISNQRETVVVWDRLTGKPLAPAIVWQCQRSSAICEQLRRDGLEPLLRERTGLGIDTLFSASKMRWLLENIPGLPERASTGEVCFGTIDSWLIWKLTGGSAHLCDASNASRTQLLNLAQGDWDEELLAIFGVPRTALPQVRDSSGVFGRCKGIIGLEGVPIVSAMGDSHAAMAGHGSYEPGTVKATYGTGSSLMTLLSALEAPRHGVASTIAWSLNGKPQYALEGNIAMTGAGLAWVGEFLGLAQPVEDAATLAASVSSSEGVYLVPAMSGLSAPYWDGEAKGNISGLTRTSRAAHLARAAVESIAYQIRDVFDAMAAGASCDLPELHTDGGATKNDTLMQFQADILGKPVVRAGCEDLSAMGAAFFGGLALGWWTTMQQLTAMVRDASTFTPTMATAEKDRLYSGWKTAVARTRLRASSEEQPHE
ncbi:glycerol kinase GlpK [Granulicella sp. WH15]|uniref:FGGY family carbohydrate kinase n=1 Tax=Granulicella sp. WH15 TaxID=2602070 RepID=UPI001C6FDC31|nr:glycerol kinase GlpK [Granulicella sp. WH15]